MKPAHLLRRLAQGELAKVEGVAVAWTVTTEIPKVAVRS
jgi:hypothetical protein